MKRNRKRMRVVQIVRMVNKKRPELTLTARVPKPCKHDYEWDRGCGAQVCTKCDHHKGLARCYCGWSLTGRNGRKELIDMGEVIDADY